MAQLPLEHQPYLDDTVIPGYETKPQKSGSKVSFDFMRIVFRLYLLHPDYKYLKPLFPHASIDEVAELIAPYSYYDDEDLPIKVSDFISKQTTVETGVQWSWSHRDGNLLVFFTESGDRTLRAFQISKDQILKRPIMETVQIVMKNAHRFFAEYTDSSRIFALLNQKIKLMDDKQIVDFLNTNEDSDDFIADLMDNLKAISEQIPDFSVVLIQYTLNIFTVINDLFQLIYELYRKKADADQVTHEAILNFQKKQVGDNTIDERLITGEVVALAEFTGRKITTKDIYLFAVEAQRQALINDDLSALTHSMKQLIYSAAFSYLKKGHEKGAIYQYLRNIAIYLEKLKRLENLLNDTTSRYNVSPLLLQLTSDVEYNRRLAQQFPPFNPDISDEATKMIYKALEEAIYNARKYSKKPETEITSESVALEIKTTENDVIILVSNVGADVKMKKAETLFEEGIRGEEVQDEIPGSGLGLSIIRENCEQNGGSAKFIDPKEGYATTLEMTLPKDLFLLAS